MYEAMALCFLTSYILCVWLFKTYPKIDRKWKIMFLVFLIITPIRFLFFILGFERDNININISLWTQVNLYIGLIYYLESKEA